MMNVFLNIFESVRTISYKNTLNCLLRSDKLEGDSDVGGGSADAGHKNAGNDSSAFNCASFLPRY